jgi:hypothetical protein
MMNSQDSRSGWGASTVARLAVGETVHAGRGRLEVVDGVVWLTRRGDPHDHLLERGQAFEVHAHDDVLFESWGPAQALIDWQPLDRATLLRRDAVDCGAALLRFAAARCSAAAAGLLHAADHLARIACTTTNRAARGNCSA